MLPTAFLALTIVRTLAGLLSSLVFIIQLKLPNKNKFVAGLGLTIALFNFLRVIYTLIYDTTADLQSDRLSCWSNFVIGVYLNNAEHLMALGVTLELWCMVRNSLVLQQSERKAMFLTLLLPALLCAGMVGGIYFDQNGGSVLQGGAVALRVDKCFMQRPAWAAWVGILGINFTTSILILIFSVHIIIQIISTVRKTSHIFSQKSNIEPPLDNEIDPSYVKADLGRKYSNASQVIPPKFYARILVLLVFCLVYSLISTVTIAIKLHSNPMNEAMPASIALETYNTGRKSAYIISPSQPSAKTVDKNHFVECADFLGAFDGIIVFFIFGSSSEAILHFWQPLKQSLARFFSGMLSGTLNLYQGILMLLCCGKCGTERRRSGTSRNSEDTKTLLRPYFPSDKPLAFGNDDTFGRKYADAKGLYFANPSRKESFSSQAFQIPSNGEVMIPVTRLDVPSFVDASKAPYLMNPTAKTSTHERKFSIANTLRPLGVVKPHKRTGSTAYNYSSLNTAPIKNEPDSPSLPQADDSFNSFRYPKPPPRVERISTAFQNEQCSQHYPESLAYLDDSAAGTPVDSELSEIQFSVDRF